MVGLAWSRFSLVHPPRCPPFFSPDNRERPRSARVSPPHQARVHPIFANGRRNHTQALGRTKQVKEADVSFGEHESHPKIKTVCTQRTKLFLLDSPIDRRPYNKSIQCPNCMVCSADSFWKDGSVTGRNRQLTSKGQLGISALNVTDPRRGSISC